MAAALFFCASTVARFATALSLLAGAFLFFAGKRNKKSGIGFLVLAVMFFFSLGTGPPDAPGGSERARAVSAAAKDYPLLGVGLGSFEDLYSRYQDGRPAPLGSQEAVKLGSSGPPGRWEAGKQALRAAGKPESQEAGKRGQNAVEPHSLPASQLPSRFGAEISAESGVLAFAVLLLAAGYLIFRISKIRYRRRDRHAAAVGTGAGAGFLALVLLGLTGPHTLAFPHLLCGAVLAAAGKAAVFRRGRGFKERFFYNKRKVSLPVAARISVVGAIAALVVVAGMPLVENRETLGSWEARKLGSRPSGPLESQEARKLGSEKQNAVERPSLPASQPPSGRASAQRPSVLASQPPSGRASAPPPSSSAALEEALSINPAQPHLWLALGQTYAARRSDPFAFVNTWLPRADGCFIQAASYAPHAPAVLMAAADHFVERAAMLAGDVGQGRGNAIARFQDYYRRALTVDPALWRAAADRVWTFFPEERIVMGIVPSEREELRDRVLRHVVSKE